MPAHTAFSDHGIAHSGMLLAGALMRVDRPAYRKTHGFGRFPNFWCFLENPTAVNHS